jgi:hypothetical protein
MKVIKHCRLSDKRKCTLLEYSVLEVTACEAVDLLEIQDDDGF